MAVRCERCSYVFQPLEQTCARCGWDPSDPEPKQRNPGEFDALKKRVRSRLVSREFEVHSEENSRLIADRHTEANLLKLPALVLGPIYLYSRKPTVVNLVHIHSLPPMDVKRAADSSLRNARQRVPVFLLGTWLRLITVVASEDVPDGVARVVDNAGHYSPWWSWVLHVVAVYDLSASRLHMPTYNSPLNRFRGAMGLGHIAVADECRQLFS